MSGYGDQRLDEPDVDHEPPPFCYSSPDDMPQDDGPHSWGASSPGYMLESPRGMPPHLWQSSPALVPDQVPADSPEHNYGLSADQLMVLWCDNEIEKLQKHHAAFDAKFKALQGIPEDEPQKDDCMCCGRSFPVGTHDGEECTTQQMQEFEEACLWVRFWMYANH